MNSAEVIYKSLGVERRKTVTDVITKLLSTRPTEPATHVIDATPLNGEALLRRAR